MKKYQYKIVAPFDIIQEKKGAVNLGNTQAVGLTQWRINQKLANKRIMEEYFAEVGMQGWEIVTDLEYVGLPRNLGLIFRKEYEVEDENPETTEATPDFTENRQKGNLYQIYERETGKHAIWHDKVTKGYSDWEKKYLAGQSAEQKT